MSQNPLCSFSKSVKDHFFAVFGTQHPENIWRTDRHNWFSLYLRNVSTISCQM